MRRRAPAIVLSVALAAAAATGAARVLAQAVPREAVEGQPLGWLKTYTFPSAPPPVTVDHRVYTSAQLAFSHRFASWMHASYLPTGAVGDVTTFVSPKLTAYNQDSAAWPLAYGASVNLYTTFKYGATKKIEPVLIDPMSWVIAANGSFGLPVSILNTRQQSFLTIPNFVEQGYGPELEAAASVAAHPFLSTFPTWFARNSVSGNRRVMLLTRDRQLPFRKVTRGEYLDALAPALVRAYDAEKARIIQAEQGNLTRAASALARLDQNQARRLAVLAENRARYQSRLQEIAEIHTTDPSVLLENASDVFIGNGGSAKRLTVYTIDPDVLERCRTGGPQWVTVSWTAQLNDPVSKHLHESVLNNFNFQYLYDFVFGDAPARARAYAPTRAPSFTRVVTPLPASEATRRHAADPATFFFEDFSTTPLGAPPINWRSTLDNTGASSTVAELRGLEGHWAAMNGFTIRPTHVKSPLPADFTLSYDLVAARNYTWGARGLTMKLARIDTRGTESSFSLRLRPGSGTADGEAVLSATFPGTQGFMAPTTYLVARGFSNSEQNNRIAVMLVKRGEALEVYLDTVKVGTYPKAIPATLQFESLVFALSGQASAADQMYIGNIRIGI